MPDLDNLLQDYEPVKFIYKGCVISEDNKYSYIFTSEKLLKILEKSSEIFIDGTFSVVPRVPNFAQLFSVHVRYMDKGIAVLFILCEARTQLVYKSIWKEVNKLAPDLQCNLRFIMCDYEKASMNAVQEQFPHASVRGCWFHYCQAVLKKWKRLELLTAPYKIVSMAMTLALAPSEMFSEGLNLMQMIAEKECENYSNIMLFMKYMRNTWLPISRKISVYGCPIRTNNLVESFHNNMLKKIHMVHPNLWVFLDNISKIILDQEINYDRLVNGLQITKDRSQSNNYKNGIIQKAQIKLSTGIYSLKEFLQLFEKENLLKQHKIALLIDDDNEMENSNLYKEETTGLVVTCMKDTTQCITHFSEQLNTSVNNSNELKDDDNEMEICDSYKETTADLVTCTKDTTQCITHHPEQNTSINNSNILEDTRKKHQQCEVVIKRIDTTMPKRKRRPLSIISTTNILPKQAKRRQHL